MNPGETTVKILLCLWQPEEMDQSSGVESMSDVDDYEPGEDVPEVSGIL